MASVAAVVDVGSNTVRLVVARCEASQLTTIHTERVRLGLGDEIETEGRLSDAAIATTAETVKRLDAAARTHHAEQVDVVVTAPGRQPENGRELVAAIERSINRRVRSLSAEEEARLAFAGAVGSAETTAPIVGVVDLGGASTEIAVGVPETGPQWVRSIDLGALRLTTRFLQHAPPEPAELDAARAAIAEAFTGTTPPLPGAALVVGGSARALGRVYGETLRTQELSSAASMLAQCDPREIARKFPVGEGRASLLLAAALILGEVQRRLVVPLTVSPGGVREGVLLEAAAAAAAA